MTNLESFRKGMIMSLPLSVGVSVYGIVYGILTRDILTDMETILSCLLIFAGVSQMMVLDMWTSPLPVMMLIVSTFIINIRYVLMSASLYPYASDAKGWQSYFSVFFMIDESWALALSEMPKGSVTITFLLGSGFANYLFWISSTMIGRTMGSFMPSPEAIGIDFVFTALFLTIIASGFKGKKDMPVILSALGAALIAEHYLGGKWYILIGGLVGSFAGWQTYEHK